jgi:ABC-type transporter Mla subunit MlaD
MAQESGGLSGEKLKQAASESVAGGDISARVRDLTLQALQARHFDFAAFRDVMKSMTEGISMGAEQRGQDARQALAEAFKGMDQAMTKAAQASSLALKELGDRGRQFSDKELKQALDQMKAMETDFLESVRQVAGTTRGTVKTGWEELVQHAQRAGTDTGAVVSQTMRDFSQRMASTMADTTLASMDAARQMGERFAQIASGFLSAMAMAVKPDKGEGKK